MPPFPGPMPPGMGMPPGPGMPGPGGAPPMPDDPTSQLAMTAMSRLLNKPPHGAIRMQRVVQALQTASKLIAAALPDVAETRPRVSKNLHVIGRQIADAIIELQDESEPGQPPEAMFTGMGVAGLPGAGVPGATV